MGRSVLLATTEPIRPIRSLRKLRRAPQITQGPAFPSCHSVSINVYNIHDKMKRNYPSRHETLRVNCGNNNKVNVCSLLYTLQQSKVKFMCISIVFFWYCYKLGRQCISCITLCLTTVFVYCSSEKITASRECIMRSYARARNETRIFQAEIYVETRHTAVQYMGVNDGTPHQSTHYILLKQDTYYLVNV